MRIQAFITFIAVLVAAATTSSSSIAEYVDYGVQRRELSPFVRRNLVQAQFSPTRSHFMGRHPRRLADGNCTADPTVCVAGQACCDAVCAVLNTDANNCGHCRYKCAFGLSCCSGKCVNLQTDRTNCGACGAACSTVTCSMGFCGYAG